MFKVIERQRFFYLIGKKRTGMQFLLVININLGPISHRFRDMASFPLKTHIFSTLLHLTPNLKLFLLHCIPHILYAKGLRRRLIISVKNSLFDSMLTSVTDGRTTEDRQMSDDNCPCSKKFQNFKQNDAFLCKIFTICKMHSVNRGRPPPPHFALPPWIRHCERTENDR